MLRRVSGWMKLTCLIAVATVAWVVPDRAAAEDLNLDAEWGASPAEATGAIDADFNGGDWRKYKRRERTVQMHDETWTQFLVFHEDRLIAKGYERDETPQQLRVGTLSYNNDYWVASALTARLGEPDFKDVRTKGDYSEELGDPAKRAKRSVFWDLRGERFRWKTDSGPVRYSVKFSLKGKRNHRLVKVDPDAMDDYHYYQISRAFRRAGIRILKRFKLKSKKMVVAMATSSGETVKTEVDTGEHELVPVEPEKRQYQTRNCEVDGHECTITYHTYGGWIYKVEVDLSSSGRIGRRERGAFDKIGERVYGRYLSVNDRLDGMFGERTADTSVTDLNNDRKLAKVQRLPEGMEAFWTVWYRPERDMLTRHVITGDNSGAEWHIDHKVVFRLHSVTRAFADERAWKAEASKIEKTSEKMNEAKRRNADLLKGSDESETDRAEK
ncbi:MAG: hypothetical protein ABEN55_06555, partial [Bradymonadaceae bacterium]